MSRVPMRSVKNLYPFLQNESRSVSRVRFVQDQAAELGTAAGTAADQNYPHSPFITVPFSVAEY